MGDMEPVIAKAATQRLPKQKLHEAGTLLNRPLSCKSAGAWQSRDQNLTCQNIDRWLEPARRN